MGLQVETVKDLKRLLNQVGLKINTLEELQNLLASLNATYNPDEARVRSARTISTVTTWVSFGAAFLGTFYLMPVLIVGSERNKELPWPIIPLIALLWLVAGAVSSLALRYSHSLLRGREQRQDRATPLEEGVRQGEAGPATSSQITRPSLVTNARSRD